MTQSYRLGRFRSTVMGNIVGIVVLCMMLVVGSTTLGLYQIRQSNEKLRFVVESEYPLSAALSTIVAHRMEQSLLMEKLLRMRLSGTVSDAAYVTATKTRFDLLTSQIRDELNDASARIQNLAAVVAAKESSDITEILATVQEAADEQALFGKAAKDALRQATFGNASKAYKALNQFDKRHAELDHELQLVLSRLHDIFAAAASEAIASENRAFALAFALSGAAVFASILLAMWLGAGKLSRPLRTLVDGLKKLSKGDFSMELRPSGADEIADIARAYGNLKRQIVESREAEQIEKAAQLSLNREVKLLSELNEWLQSSSSMDELFKMVTEYFMVLLPDCKGEIYVYSNSRDVLDGMCGWNGAVVQDHIRPSECWALRRGRSYVYGHEDSMVNFACEHVIQSIEKSPECGHGDCGCEDHEGHTSTKTNGNIPPYICFPFLAHGETLGMMHLAPAQGVAADVFFKQAKLARMAAEQVSIAIANTRMRDELHYQSIQDPLTGLYNRRHFLERFRAAIEKAKHSGGKVSLISIDVDHFKKFNDNHGHDAGDMVLRAVGTAMEQSFDGEQLPCRIGGEEFVALLPATTAENAAGIADNLRQTIEKVAVRYGEKTLPKITISCGVAAYPDHGQVPQDVLKMADDALYASKGNGRNCVTLAGLTDNPDADTVLYLDDPDVAEPETEETYAI